MDMRCGAKLHGIVVEPGVVEIKCDSKFCRPSPGTTVLHRFNADTGDLIDTLTFKNPERSRDGSRRDPSAVRSA